MAQMTLAANGFEAYRKMTRKAEFLSRMDSRHGLTHSASITPANVHDSQELPNQDVLKEIAPNAKDFTNKRASRNRPLTGADKEPTTGNRRCRQKSSICSARLRASMVSLVGKRKTKGSSIPRRPNK